MQLRNAREQAGLTQQRLAERINCDVKSISRWENGHRLPDTADLVLLADGIGVPLSDWCGEPAAATGDVSGGPTQAAPSRHNYRGSHLARRGSSRRRGDLNAGGARRGRPGPTGTAASGMAACGSTQRRSRRCRRVSSVAGGRLIGCALVRVAAGWRRFGRPRGFRRRSRTYAGAPSSGGTRGVTVPL
ncbi:helix-turn-helix domain-containing protein [Streptomyces sp. NPDC012510]|uniref:helix-turn-helix domain-containing protein n=1 Tax=Streptomyces sp. NPDC012510 TaxID=3364838 RepID=UPI0036EFB109